jgi:hypothetical protein
MKAGRRAALALACCWLAGAHPQESERGREQQREPAPAPDLDFLEYLGAWVEGDDEWLAIEEWRKDAAADAPDAKESGLAKRSEPEGAKESETERDDDHESE